MTDSKKSLCHDITKRRTNCGGPDNDGDDDWALMNITEAELDRSRETVLMMTTTKMSFGSLTMKDNDQY